MTSGITMTWVLTFKPNVAEAFWADILKSIAGTRSFPGCRQAHMYRSDADSDRIMLFSEWDSRQDYEKYSAWRAESDRIVAGVPASRLPSLLAEPSVRHFWNVRE